MPRDYDLSRQVNAADLFVVFDNETMRARLARMVTGAFENPPQHLENLPQQATPFKIVRFAIYGISDTHYRDVGLYARDILRRLNNHNRYFSKIAMASFPRTPVGSGYGESRLGDTHDWFIRPASGSLKQNSGQALRNVSRLLRRQGIMLVARIDTSGIHKCIGGGSNEARIFPFRCSIYRSGLNSVHVKSNLKFSQRHPSTAATAAYAVL